MAEVSTPPPIPPSSLPNVPKKRIVFRSSIDWFVLILVIGFLILIAFAPQGNFKQAQINSMCQSTNAVGTAMYLYSLDHNGQYPTGKSSTEVFQKLIDGHYVTDATIFFCPIASDLLNKKVASSDILKPENVGFDVTVPIRDDSPAGLPIVFPSGFKITYEPGTNAISLAPFGRMGIAAAYKDNRHPSAWNLWWFNRFNVIYQTGKLSQHTNLANPIPNFVPTSFTPDSTKYQQLTPDGPLPQ